MYAIFDIQVSPSRQRANAPQEAGYESGMGQCGGVGIECPAVPGLDTGQSCAEELAAAARDGYDEGI